MRLNPDVLFSTRGETLLLELEAEAESPFGFGLQLTPVGKYRHT